MTYEFKIHVGHYKKWWTLKAVKGKMCLHCLKKPQKRGHAALQKRVPKSVLEFIEKIENYLL